MLTAAELELAAYAANQLMTYATTFHNNVVAGSATRTDLDDALDKLDMSYDELVAARKDQKIREQQATAINAAADTAPIAKVPDGGTKPNL